MGASTGIEWTDSTWNPLRGCSRVSEGCRNCYAEKVALRFSGPGLAYEGLAVLKNGHASWTGNVTLVEKHLLDPLKWGPVVADCWMCGAGPNDSCMHGAAGQRRRRRRIFVNSMSDLFHENVPDEWIDRSFAVMALCPQHDFQVLTKRPERMREYFLPDAYQQRNGRNQMRLPQILRAVETVVEVEPRAANMHEQAYMTLREGGPLPNVWLGVSVENQAAADERIPLLLQTPAAVRFISAEPLLGPVDLRCVKLPGPNSICQHECELDAFSWRIDHVPALNWVICGGESGSGARPMHPDWARSLRDQCEAAGVPFFFKQWGEWAPGEQLEDSRPHDVVSWFNGKWSPDSDDWISEADNGPLMYRVGKKAAGALLDGGSCREFPKEEQ